MYVKELFTKNSCLPSSIIFPFSKTKILSQFITVDNLCAIIIVVLFLVRFSMAFWITDSDSESKDDVASSNNIIEEFFNMALAIDNLCFWPPDNLMPFSPIIVSYLFGSFSTKSCAAENLHAFMIS